MKNKELQKTNYAGRIEAAMALIRQGQVNRVTRTPAPETFELHCLCARVDKPYTLRFNRQPSGLLRFAESVKGEMARPTGHVRKSGASTTMWLDLFETTAVPCAWCGNRSFHHCAWECGALVCGGRMQGNTFHCRSSCGAQWVGVPLQQVEGTGAEQPRLPSLRAPAPTPARRLLLGPGPQTNGQP